MALTVGSRLGHYDVTALIGEGGMGQVYRATDTQLNRDVALKILPDAFAADPDRLARFQREAQVLASLNHPGIAQIYGIEKTDDTQALVLELVEGPTLADRIAKGPIPLDEALPIAKQIAEALEAAHEAGVIHRDLKPANIKVREDGTVKVLDFGLAKALEQTQEGDPNQSPTHTDVATHMGVIMGTAAYMSPEQARGKAVDRRADVWAFGCVLFEMLTGTKPFPGDDVSQTLARVIDREPDWNVLPKNVPPVLGTYLRRCLEKELRQRVQAIGDVRLAMGGAFETAVPQTPAAGMAPQIQFWKQPLPVAVIVILVVLVTGLAVWSLMGSGGTTSSPLRRFAIDLGPASPIAVAGVRAMPALSPDGARLVYSANLTGTPQLYLRGLDELEAHPITGTENAYEPFFSPDGEWVGFCDPIARELKRVAVRGGAPLTLSQCYPPTGATWLADGTIVFSHATERGGGVATLFRIPEAGGTPEPLTTLDAESAELAHHAWPHALPGGTAVLFTIMPELESADASRVAVLSLETGEQHIVVRGGYNARYVPTGHLIFARQGALWGVPFDVDQLATTGPEEVVLQGLELNEDYGSMALSVSGDGSLVYVSGTAGTGFYTRFAVWVDREGREEPLPLPPGSYQAPRLSPDGTRLAVVVFERDETALWVYDVVSAAGLRLTHEANASTPVWTPDGDRVVFDWDVAGTGDLHWVPADGSGEIERLVESEVKDVATSVTPDGRAVIFSRLVPGGGAEIWEVPLDGERTPIPLLQGEFSRGNGDVSPDGDWLAYRSDQSGQMEIYLQPYPGPGPTVPVSIGGGHSVTWSADGSELFYRGRGNRMMAVALNSDGFTRRLGTPTELFQGSYLMEAAGGSRQYHVAPDGRFLMLTGNASTDEGSPPAQLTFVQHWFEELKERVPVE